MELWDLYTEDRQLAGMNHVRGEDVPDVWMFRYEGEPDMSHASSDEAAQFAWMSREQILQLFKEKKYVDTLACFFTEVDQKG